MDEVVCLKCMKHLSERQLITKSVCVESCPHCRSMVRQSEGIKVTKTELLAAEDISSLAEWLEQESGSLNLKIETIREREGDGEFRWRVSRWPQTDYPKNWSIELVYLKDVPRHVKVQIIVVDNDPESETFSETLLRVAYDHGVQPHLGRTYASGFGGPDFEKRWGVVQHLGIGIQMTGLLRPVVTRLLAAMRDASGMLKR